MKLKVTWWCASVVIHYECVGKHIQTTFIREFSCSDAKILKQLGVASSDVKYYVVGGILIYKILCEQYLYYKLNFYIEFHIERINYNYTCILH